MRMHHQGMSIRTIAEKLTAKGVPTVTGGPWHPATVHRVVRREQELAAQA
jgi:Recombinase